MFPFHKSTSQTRSQTARRNSRSKRPTLGMETCEERNLMAFGAEFAIGSHQEDNHQVATASADNGMSVAVWMEDNGGGDTDILGQLYNADGSKRGRVINVSTGSASDSQPAVAMEDNGDFAVSFTREHNFGFLNSQTDKDIRVERFNASGGALGGTTAVSTSNSENAFDSDIAMDANGDFVIAYTSEVQKTRTAFSVFGFPFTQSFTDRDVRARRFNSAGNAVGGTFSIDGTSTRMEDSPSVAMGDDGRFMVAYEDGSDIHVRRFNNGGGFRGNSTIATSSRFESQPDIALDSNGNGVVVWKDATNGSDIKGRRISDNGNRSTTITVRGTTAFEANPSVALSDNGQYVVAYERAVSGGGLVATNVDTTRVNANNTLQGSQSLGLGMSSPSVSLDGNDRYFVGYNDFIDEQAIGRFGQMGSNSPTDKTAHNFDIDLAFTGFTASQRAIFQQAADRWQQVIVGDLPDSSFNGIFVDDVRIDAISNGIDGPGFVLGQAGPDSIRTNGSLPVHGNMTFDTADINRLESQGRLFNVMLHEMGHVLGVGTLWSTLGLVQNVGTPNVRYTGSNGVAGYNAARGFMGIISPATSIPVESDGGAGTADAHWDETTFDGELMTGTVESVGIAMPLSRMTVGSLEDMGYQVNYAAADPYFVPFNRFVAIGRSLTIGGGPALVEDSDEPLTDEVVDDRPAKRELEIQKIDHIFGGKMDDFEPSFEHLQAAADELHAFVA